MILSHLTSFQKFSLFRHATLLFSAIVLFSTSASAHEDHVHSQCEAVTASVSEAGFADRVTVSCSDDQILITSDTYPNHELMTGIVGTNEQLPVPATYAAPIPSKPSLGTAPLTRDAALGVAINGVPIYDYTGGGEMSEADLYHHQDKHDTLLTEQLDICGGHAGRGDDYHYHVKPTCMIDNMANAGDAAIIGWAFDGFPIYGDNNPDGTPIAVGVLDVCNGQTDNTFGYRYHTSPAAPYIVQCLMGEVASFDSLPRVRPLASSEKSSSEKSPAEKGKGREAGRPPRGGVQNLVFTQDASGTRSMDYTYEGEAYYMRYEPTDQANCYAFETRTVTDDGVVKTGEYCR